MQEQVKIPAELSRIDDMTAFLQYEIKEESDLERLAIVGQKAASRIKELDALRLSMTGPIKEGIKKIESEFHRLTDPLKELKNVLNLKVSTYWDAQHKIKEEAARKARDAQLAEEKLLASQAAEKALATGSELAELEYETRQKVISKMEEQPIEVKQTVRAYGATMAQTRVWKFRIIDETKVPRHFLMINDDAIKAALKANKGREETLKVDGVEFYQESRASFGR